MPRSPYLLFAITKREDVQAESPDADHARIAKLLAREWMKLSGAEKLEWKAKAVTKTELNGRSDDENPPNDSDEENDGYDN
jgi:hypothetical protein